MRLMIRALLAILLVVLLGLAGLALFLPRLVRSDAVRTRLEAAAREATGREIGYADLRVGLLPPRLVVANPTVSGTAAGDPPLLEAASVDLVLALAPLFARAVVVDSLVVEGATLRLVRTPDGIELPTPGAAGAPESAEEGSEAGPALALRSLALRDARLVLEDRAVKPPVTWDLTDLSASLRAESLDEPIAFELEGRLASGGAVRAQGSAELSGSFRADVELEKVALEPAAPYLEGAFAGPGLIGGTIEAEGSADRLAKLEARLRLHEADLRLADLQLGGQVSIRADLSGPPALLTGGFEIDATQAALRYGEFFTKPPGTPATVEGRIVPGKDGSSDIDDLRLQVDDFEATGQVRSAPRTRIQLEAPPFPVESLARLIPLAEPYELRGPVALRSWSVDLEPLALRGTASLDGLQLRVPEGSALQLSGGLEAVGQAVRTRELSARGEGQRIDIDGEVSGLDAEPSYRLALSTEGADARRLFAILGVRQEVLEAPVTLRADLRGPLTGEEPLPATTRGSLDLFVDEGRLRGVSLLRGVFDQLGAIGEGALILGRVKGGRTLQRFYEDRFEAIRGTWRIAQGVARTEDLHLLYDAYRADLRGTVTLLEPQIDFTGKLTIFEEIDALLSGQEAPQRGVKRTIPLARVTGSIDAPRVQLTRETVVSLASAYALGERRGKLEGEIDERLGEGSGKQVIDALEGILGQGRR